MDPARLFLGGFNSRISILGLLTSSEINKQADDRRQCFMSPDEELPALIARSVHGRFNCASMSALRSFYNHIHGHTQNFNSTQLDLDDTEAAYSFTGIRRERWKIGTANLYSYATVSITPPFATSP